VENLPVANAALQSSGNTDFTVTTLPKISHVLQTSDTGNPADYGVSEETIAPVVFDMIDTWLAARTAR
jgi:uncharacterized protein